MIADPKSFSWFWKESICWMFSMAREEDMVVSGEQEREGGGR